MAKKEQVETTSITMTYPELLPQAVQFSSNYMLYDDAYVAVYFIQNLASVQHLAWLSNINALPLTYSLWVVPYSDIQRYRRQLTSFQNNIHATLENPRNADISRSTLQEKLSAIESVLYALDHGERPMNMSILLFISVPLSVNTKEFRTDITSYIQDIKQKLAAIGGIQLYALPGTQADMLYSVLPFGYIEKDLQRYSSFFFTNGQIATSFPFTKRSIFMRHGIIMGHTIGTLGSKNEMQDIVAINKWIDYYQKKYPEEAKQPTKEEQSLTNANMVILGSPGMGKSYATKLYMLREYLKGARIIVIDPEAEYTRIAQIIGGRVINAGSGQWGVNPFEIRDVRSALADEEELRQSDPASAARARVETILQLLLPPSILPREGDIAHIVSYLYREKGINMDANKVKNYELQYTDYPTLQDFIDAARDPDINNNEQLAKDVAVMEPYIKFFLPSSQKLDLSQDVFIVFDIHDISQQAESVRKAIYYNILQWIWDYIRRDRKEKTVLAADEAWLLIDPEHPDTIGFLNEMSKRLRKYSGSLWMITQNLKDFLQSDVFKNKVENILGNSAVKLFFRQPETDIPYIQSLYTLSETEMNLLQSMERGQALLIAGNTHMHIQVEASPFEDMVISGRL